MQFFKDIYNVIKKQTKQGPEGFYHACPLGLSPGLGLLGRDLGGTLKLIYDMKERLKDLRVEPHF